MSYPTIHIDQKKIILLSGFERKCENNRALTIQARDQLEQAAKKHSDAVAFGYVAGRWMPAA
jgi:hypothetical protein